MYEDTLQNIKSLIEQKGFKKKAIAEKMGYTENQFSALLNGRRKVGLEDIIQICNLLNVEPNDIIKIAA